MLKDMVAVVVSLSFPAFSLEGFLLVLLDARPLSERRSDCISTVTKQGFDVVQMVTYSSRNPCICVI